MKIIAFSAGLLTITATLFAQKNNKVIQFNIGDLLNARPVTTLTDGKLVKWTKGIDGNGLGDGYLTLSAALFNGDKEPHALPDDPVYPANDSHPEIKLYYNNTDSLTNQAWSITGTGNGGLTVPTAKYKFIYLTVTSAEGASSLKIQFNYEDGDEEKEYTVPDYYADIAPGDTTLSYLTHDLAKWGNKNNMTEKDHHNIDLLKVSPNPARKLMSIDIRKGQAGYLVIWAVTGVKG
jgi:hypothetical protein